MNFNATRQTEINSFSAVITLKIGEVRPEIISYIKGSKNWLSDEEQSIFEKNYLEKYLGIYNNGHLTSAGQSVIKNGKIFFPEHGLYELFLINNNLFGNRIINFKRLKPSQRISQQYTAPFEDYREYDGKFYFTLDENPIDFQIQFHFNQSNQVPQIIWNNQVNGRLTIDSGSMTGTSLTFQYNNHEYIDHDCQKFDLSENMNKLFEDWEPETESIEKSYEELNPEQLESFLTGLSTNDSIIIDGELDPATWRIEIQNIKVLPKTELDAKKWLEYLIIKQLENEKSYYTLEYVKFIQNKILAEKPLKIKYPKLWIDPITFHRNLSNQRSSLYTDIQTAQDLLPNMEE